MPILGTKTMTCKGGHFHDDRLGISAGRHIEQRNIKKET